jgi:hypothetical protein
MRKTVLYGPRNKNIAVVEQKKYHLYEEQICREQGTNYNGRGTKYHLYDEWAQGKIMAVMEQKKIIYIRNRYVEGKEQITAVMERNIIYMSNGDGTKIIICVWNRYVGGKVTN